MILEPRPDGAKAPLVVGLPGDAADKCSSIPFLSQREQVVGERPFPGELPGFALGGDLPGEGLVVAVFSDLQSLRLFGWLSAFSMVAALVADLFILRPTAMWLINLHARLQGPDKPAI